MNTISRTELIRDLNDNFRTTLEGGKCLFTKGVSALGIPFSIAALAAVKAFVDFTSDNDPYDEHDFGAINVCERRVFWKIDYYDPSFSYASRDPANPATTRRVLTIMLAEEY